MSDKLDKIEDRIEKLEEKIDYLIELMKENSQKCEKMSNHIDFIDSIYDNVKSPLGYLCNKINSFTNNDKYSLESSS